MMVFQYGDAAIHTAVRHDHVHLLPYLLGPPFQTLFLPTRNGSHIEIDHVNLQNEVSELLFTFHDLAFFPHYKTLQATKLNILAICHLQH